MKLQYRGSGKTFYAGEEYRCDLYYNEKQGGILIKVHSFEKLANYLKFPVEIEWLNGRLENGFNFLLYKLTRAGTEDRIPGEGSIFSYAAEYIFCGIEDENGQAPGFTRASFTLSDIIEWGGISGYKICDRFKLAMKDLDPCVLYKDDEMTVSYEVSASLLPVHESQLLNEKIELAQQGMIVICTASSKEFSYFHSAFQKIRKLIEISSIRKINLESVKLYSDDFFEMVGDRRINREIAVYGRDISFPEDEEEIKSSFRVFSWITLPELTETGCIQKFFEKYDLMEPILDVYLELFYAPVSARKIFLNVIQAIETYHSRFFANRLKEYKKHINDVVKDLPAGDKEETWKYLMANNEKARTITLESRLADLLYESRGIIDTGDINGKDFPRVIAQTRNYYIHYDESIKEDNRVLSIEELKIYNPILLSLLDYYIFKELGYDKNPKDQKEKLIARWGNISQQLNILKQSREKFNAQDDTS